ncbi:Rossmann-like alpha/beta/alpha sandwich fold [Ostreococcus tauri]|uniref:ethanolamine-phosphate cytidylyltransferase n=1 Tax=Ostreococcus tauri TaxID=70448 RepID=A0A090N414_OSTTA|nr:Rossmann-like alpha/beta/alpha sandwich fold [Ostreococcus tauri]CEF99073.1 Rossmann-like alpha/beta/alpha sandwich fold [Ostreococcus tauri]|eukprot:XP_022839630.1 Rossmann-like alpha/beta/alpha sandwich fold [Ostreococcus tauri]
MSPPTLVLGALVGALAKTLVDRVGERRSVGDDAQKGRAGGDESIRDDKAAAETPRVSTTETRRKTVVYMDGCFDTMHYGHANALRQARACGDVLLVGVVNDAEIRRCKGPPVCDEVERLEMVRACKWVDDVIEDVPYEVTDEFTDELFEKHGVDYVVHGDDPCLLPDGTDAYAYPKRIGKYKEIKRTEGVSTTDIVGRLLRMGARAAGEEVKEEEKEATFCTTSSRIAQFGTTRAIPADAKVVYVHGAFDVFNRGHIDLLRRAKTLGDFVLVGVHADAEVRSRRGADHPVLNEKERALSVLACRYADEVVIGAPMKITHDLLTTFNVAVVVAEDEDEYLIGGEDVNALAMKRGVFRRVDREHDCSVLTVAKRIMENRAEFEARNARKVKSESAYYAQKAHVAET